MKITITIPDWVSRFLPFLAVVPTIGIGIVGELLREPLGLNSVPGLFLIALGVGYLFWNSLLYIAYNNTKYSYHLQTRSPLFFLSSTLGSSTLMMITGAALMVIGKVAINEGLSTVFMWFMLPPMPMMFLPVAFIYWRIKDHRELIDSLNRMLLVMGFEIRGDEQYVIPPLTGYKPPIKEREDT